MAAVAATEIPRNKKLLVFIEHDVKDDAIYARMAGYVQDAVEKQFAGAQVLVNKFRAPSIFTAAIGNCVKEADPDLEKADFPRKQSFEVSFICYGPGDSMLAPTNVHSKLDSSDFPSVDLVLATISHYLTLYTSTDACSKGHAAERPNTRLLRLRSAPMAAAGAGNSAQRPAGCR